MRTYITDKKQRNGQRRDEKQPLEDKKKRTGRQIAVCLFWLAVWQAAAFAADIPLLLPGPADTAETLFELAGTKEFYLNIGWTMFRCLLSMALSFAAGAAAAWGAYRSEKLRSLLTLPVGFFKAVPVMAIIIYVVLVASADWVAVIVCFLMCFPVVYTNVLSGLDGMPRELLELARIYGLTSFQKIKYIYRPSIASQVNSAVMLIAGLSWKAVVAAEVLSIPKYSLGYEMINAKYYLETTTLFAYIFVIVAISIVIERLIAALLKNSGEKGYEGSRLFKKAAVYENARLKIQEPPMVTLADVSKSYGEKKVLEHIDMMFEKGKTTVMTGPSGRGKTTVARIISGLEKADEGRVETDVRPEIGYLFQEDRLLPWLNVYDNMAFGLLRDGASPKDGDIKRMAEELEIGGVLWELPGKLSGGMKHRVALGRTFLSKSNLIILDEPFRGLDVKLKERIMTNLWKKNTENKTVIVMTHEPDIFEGKSIKL